MLDLTPEQVEALAQASGLSILPEDLEEVTLRVNAFVSALASLDQLPLDNVQPIPLLPHPEVSP